MTEKIAARMDNIDHKLNELQKDMEEIWILLGEMKSDLRKNRGKSDSKNRIKRKKKITAADDKNRWKREMYRQAKMLVTVKSSFKSRADVLHYIYNYMRKNYGIVWEQDIKEYKKGFGIEYKPKTIDIVYDNKMYKSIFEAVLIDMVAKEEIYEQKL